MITHNGRYGRNIYLFLRGLLVVGHERGLVVHLKYFEDTDAVIEASKAVLLVEEV